MGCPYKKNSALEKPFEKEVDLSFCHGSRADTVVTREIASMRDKLSDWQVVTNIVQYGQSAEKRAEHSYIRWGMTSIIFDIMSEDLILSPIQSWRPSEDEGKKLWFDIYMQIRKTIEMHRDAWVNFMCMRHMRGGINTYDNDVFAYFTDTIENNTVLNGATVPDSNELIHTISGMLHMIELKLIQLLERKPTLDEVLKSIENSKLKTALKRYMFNTFDSAHFFLEQLRDPYNDNAFPTYRVLPDGHYDQTDFFDEMIFTMDPESLKLSFKPEFAEFINAQLMNDPSKLQAGCPMIHSTTFDSFSQWIIDLHLYYRFGAPIKGCQVLDANESTILRRVKSGLKKKYRYTNQ